MAAGLPQRRIPVNEASSAAAPSEGLISYYYHIDILSISCYLYVKIRCGWPCTGKSPGAHGTTSVAYGLLTIDTGAAGRFGEGVNDCHSRQGLGQCTACCSSPRRGYLRLHRPPTRLPPRYWAI